MRAERSIFSLRTARALLGRYSACTRGVTAIEFAFVAPMVIAIMLAAIQISTLYVAQAYLESVTESAMRLVLTNTTAGYTQAQFDTAICAEVSALFSCSGLIVDLQPIDDCTSGTLTTLTTCLNNHYQPQFNANGTLINQPTFNVGNNGDKMRLLVMYQWPLISGPVGMSLGVGGTRLLSAVEIFYKEPCLTTNVACVNNG